MEKGKGKPPAGDNYDSVNMEMSDDDSDNEMFACKDEYKAFKQHFDNKSKGKQAASRDEASEYGGGPDPAVGGFSLGIEYGSGLSIGGGNPEYGGGSSKPLRGASSSEYGGGSSEYGGGSVGDAATGGTSHQMRGGHQSSVGGYQPRSGGGGHGHHHQPYPRRSPTPPKPTPAKIEREPKLYKDGDKDRKSKSRQDVFFLFICTLPRIWTAKGVHDT
jgi:hypothetical protein